MPPIRSTASSRHDKLVIIISLLGEVMFSYSCCDEKGLTYITIMASSSHQPFSCAECTKANIRSLYNVHSAFDSKYVYYMTLLIFFTPYLIYFRVLYSFY